MSRLLILGATGSLGRHVLRQAVAAEHDVTVFVRTPSKLPSEVRERVSVHTGDLGAVVPPDLVDMAVTCQIGNTFPAHREMVPTVLGLRSSIVPAARCSSDG